MPLNIADAESSFSKGMVEFLEWKEKFEARWIAPLAMTQLALTMKTLTPRERADFAPQIERVEKLLKGR
jgi:hypothetical protein